MWEEVVRRGGVRLDNQRGKDHCIVRFFFFSSRRRHTRLQGDWSSDVCSSDLALEALAELRRLLVPVVVITNQSAVGRGLMTHAELNSLHAQMMAAVAGAGGQRSEEGRVGEECRSRGAPDHLKKKKKT